MVSLIRRRNRIAPIFVRRRLRQQIASCAIAADVDSTFREYAWNYFQVHAQQRLQTFEFYITISTATLAGLIALIQAGKVSRWLSLIGLALTFISFVFWKLDSRTRDLIQNAEAALERLDAAFDLPDEDDGTPNVLRIFTRDATRMDHLPSLPLADGHFSYSKCFRLFFFVMGTSGLAMAIWFVIA